MQTNTDPVSKSSVCVQCGKCSSGCPVAFESGHTPRRVLRLLQLGQTDAAQKSPFIWYCAMCQTCAVRCPQGVEIPELMLALRRLEFAKNGGRRDLWYYRIFAGMAEKGGAISELRLGIAAALRNGSRHPFEDALLLYKLWRRGKI